MRADPALPRPAATVAVLRDGPDGPEVLLTQRPATMAFGPRLHVFPGGALEAGDADPALLARLRVSRGGDPAGLHGAPFVVAAIREMWEEAGILLASAAAPGPLAGAPVSRAVPDAGVSFHDLVLGLDLDLRGDWLVPLSRWITPPVVPRRYDARFFVAWLPDGTAPVFDPGEVAGHDWLTPEAGLRAMAEGRIELWMPTSTTLQQLAPVRTAADLVGLAPVRPWAAPVVEEIGGTDGAVTRVRLGGGGGVPGTAGTAWIVGRERVVIIDPGDPGDDAADALLGVVRAKGAAVGAVLITAPFPARAAGGEGMALRLGVPLLATTDAARVLAAHVTPVSMGDLAGVADVELRIADGREAAAGTGFGRTATLACELPGPGLVIRGGPDLDRL